MLVELAAGSADAGPGVPLWLVVLLLVAAVAALVELRELLWLRHERKRNDPPDAEQQLGAGRGVHRATERKVYLWADPDERVVGVDRDTRVTRELHSPPAGFDQLDRQEP